MAAEIWAFVDEYGNPNLATETPGVSLYFIVSAIVLDEREVPGVRDRLEQIRRAHFQQGEMKSKTLGKARHRWHALLTDLRKVPFKFYALVVDKTAIDKTSGLQWKQSFYKNICGRAYNKMMKAYPSLRVRADQYGRDDFMESFRRYIETNHRQTLFDLGTFEFIDGKTEVCVQLADIVCGLLARCYDPERRLERPEELLALVADHALLVDEWPPRFRLRTGTGELARSSGRDDRIAQYSVSCAEDYILSHEDDKDGDTRARVATLERLLFEQRFGSERYVTTAALLELLASRGVGVPQEGETWFRRAVIAPLRDAGVIVTSSPSGYTLPTSATDLSAFLRHADNVCVPMLRRAEAACTAIRLATKGEVDVLEEPAHAMVRALIVALSDQKKSHVEDE